MRSDGPDLPVYEVDDAPATADDDVVTLDRPVRSTRAVRRIVGAAVVLLAVAIGFVSVGARSRLVLGDPTAQGCPAGRICRSVDGAGSPLAAAVRRATGTLASRIDVVDTVDAATGRVYREDVRGVFQADRWHALLSCGSAPGRPEPLATTVTVAPATAPEQGVNPSYIEVRAVVWHGADCALSLTVLTPADPVFGQPAAGQVLWQLSGRSMAAVDAVRAVADDRTVWPAR